MVRIGITDRTLGTRGSRSSRIGGGPQVAGQDLGPRARLIVSICLRPLIINIAAFAGVGGEVARLSHHCAPSAVVYSLIP